MAEEFIIKLVSDDFSAGVSSSGATSSSSGGGGGAVGGMAKMAGTLGAIGIGVQQIMSIIGPVVNDLLRPVKNILKGIFKLIGELLRPIVEIAIMLLRPVLALIKPLISIFKAFMAPFMAIAREFTNLAVAQFAEGDVAGGMENIMAGISSILGPFVVSLSSIVLQLASNLFISGIERMMLNILDVIELLFGGIPLGIGDAITGGLDKAREGIKTASAVTKTFLNSAITDGTVEILGEMETVYKKKLAEAKGLADETSLDVIAPLEDMKKNSSAIMEDSFSETGVVYGTYKLGMTNMGIETETAMGTSKDSIPSKFETGLTHMETNTDTFVEYMKKKGEELVSEAEGYARNIKKNAKYEFNLIKIGG